VTSDFPILQRGVFCLLCSIHRNDKMICERSTLLQTKRPGFPHAKPRIRRACICKQRRLRFLAK
jgi:hypothetical protein